MIFKTTAQRLALALALALLVGLSFGLILGLLISKNAAQGEIGEPAAVETVAAAPDTLPKTIQPAEPHFESLGAFTVTAYCSCEQCCGKSDGITATGAKAIAGKTIAVDPTVIPYGSTVMIDGVPYTAQDTLTRRIIDRYQGKIIDVYFDNHQAALEYGKQEHEVFLLAE